MIFAKRALLADGWAANVRVSLSEGRIADIAAQSAPVAGDTCVDALLPALGNVHSHSFQRAMAGMTEVRRAGRDSFWTWRDLMYRFTLQLTPDQIEAIAALVFLEMQETGFAAVGEFHYFHHQPDGQPYDDIAEMSQRIAAAAGQTGIGLTLLPVLYTYGGAGRQPLGAGQVRFGNDVSRFAQLLERAGDVLHDLPADSALGIAPHSLRATSPDDLAAVLAARRDGPVHIHAAEQPKEVSDVQQWLSARPVEWLLANADVGPAWCLIHATHMTKAETVALAQSGAVTGLCPLTEANLGDGPFNGPDYLEAGGRFGIGSDSNILISVPQELRMLEYSQRLRDLARNVMVTREGSVGELIYKRAATGGAQALGRKAGVIAQGYLADLVAIDATSPALCALRDDQLLDGMIFAAKDNVVTDLWSAGRHMVQGGQHVARASVIAAYRKAMGSLLDAL